MALFLAISPSAKAQENDTQDGFSQIYQFYKNKIILPGYGQDNFEFGKRPNSILKPKVVETENNADLSLLQASSLSAGLPAEEAGQASLSFKKLFSPVIKSAGKIKDGYLSIGEETVSFSSRLFVGQVGLFGQKYDNFSAAATTQNQRSFSSPPLAIQNAGTPTGTPTGSVEGSASASGQEEQLMDFLKTQLALLDEQVKKIEKSGLVFSLPPANTDKIKKEIAALAATSSDGITKEYLEERLTNLNANLTNQINNLSSNTSRQTSAAFSAISLTNRIDNLSGTRLSNITVSGVTGLTDSDIPDGITASNYLPLAGGTLTGALTGTALSLSGQLTVSGTATSTLAGDANFDSGTLYIDSINNRVGIASSSPSETLSVNGATYFSQISAPSNTADRLYNTSGDLYWNGNLVGSASVGNWTSSGGNVYRASGNVGIGTTSPYAKLSVVGETVASYFTATTSTASTFPYASSTALTVSGSTYLTNLGQGWLHTDGGTNALSASTSPTVNYITATSTTASNYFAGNVGIGTASPIRKLDIEKGHIRLGPVTAPSAPVTVAINPSAGNLNGTYYYGVTFVTALGETETDDVSSASTVSPVNQQVNLTNIPTSSDSTVIARKIYRTTAGGSNKQKLLLTTINDNTTTTYTDNIPDGSLGTNEPTINTTGGLIYNGSSRVAVFNRLTTAFGLNSLASNVGYYNDAFGEYALYSNTIGYRNSAFGKESLYSNTTGIANTAFGSESLRFNTYGAYNTSSGQDSLYLNTYGNGNSAFGQGALRANTTGNYNTATGYRSGYANTTGGNNIFIGYLAGDNLTTGSNNIIIGHDIDATSTTMTRGLNIGNLLYGNNLDGSGTTLSSGNIGIGTTSPWRTLSVTGSMAVTALTAGAAGDFAVCINNTTKELTNAGASGCVVSSKRFKENISELDSGLDELMQLKPSKFTYIGQTGEHMGLIAEDVDAIDKRLVEYEADGITPRTVRYLEMSALLIKSIQELNLKVSDLMKSSTTANKATSDVGSDGLFSWIVGKFMTTLGIGFENETIKAKNADIEKLCIGNTCVTEEQFKSVFGSAQSVSSSSQSSSLPASSSSSVVGSSSSATSEVFPSSQSSSSSTSEVSSSSTDSSSSEPTTVVGSSSSSELASSESSSSEAQSSSETSSEQASLPAGEAGSSSSSVSESPSSSSEPTP